MNVLDIVSFGPGEVIKLLIPGLETHESVWNLSLRLRNQGNTSRNVSVFVGGIRVEQLHLVPSGWIRAQVDLPPESKEAEFQGDGPGWVIERLELGNAYKFSPGFLSYLVVRSNSPVSAPPLVLSFFLFFVLLALVYSEGISGYKVYRFMLLFVVLLFVVDLLVPLFTKYRFLFSLKSYSLILLVVFFPALRSCYNKACALASKKIADGADRLRLVMVTTVVLLSFVLSMKYSLDSFGGDYSGFLHISRSFTEHNPFLEDRPDLTKRLRILDTGGYDAQFFYNMTFDPFMNKFKRAQRYRKIVDHPPFRYRRIGFPLLIKAFSLDDPNLYPHTMVLLVLFSHAVAIFFIGKIALFYKRSPWWALVYILVPGFSVSTSFALPEPIAAAFLVGGIYFYLRGRIVLSIVLFASSLLVRETGALVIGILVLFEWIRRRNLSRASLLMLSFIPYFAWRAFVAWRLFEDWGWLGFFYEPGNFSPPFAGMVRLFFQADTVFFFPLLLFGLLLYSVFCLARRQDFLSWSVFLYSFLAISLDYERVWVSLLNAERHTFESFLLSILLFLSRGQESFLLRMFYFCLLFFILIYDWSFLSVSNAFRAGVLLG